MRRRNMIWAFVALVVFAIGWDFVFGWSLLGQKNQGKARITKIEPARQEEMSRINLASYGEYVNGAGELFIDHPTFGCTRASDLVVIHFDFAMTAPWKKKPDGFFRDRIFDNGNHTTGTPRALLGDLRVGDEFRATHSVSGLSLGINGVPSSLTIWALEARIYAARETQPRNTCEALGMHDAPEEMTQ